MDDVAGRGRGERGLKKNEGGHVPCIDFRWTAVPYVTRICIFMKKPCQDHGAINAATVDDPPAVKSPAPPARVLPPGHPLPWRGVPPSVALGAKAPRISGKAAHQ